MKRKIFISCVLLTLSCLVVAAKKDNSVVATVNGIKIKMQKFLQVYRQNKLFISHKKVSKKTVLDNLINRELGIQRAKKNRISSNPVVKYKLEDILYHAQVSKDLEPLLKKIIVTNSEVKAYYKTHKEYRTAHILFRLQIEPTKNEMMAAQSQAFKVYGSLKKKPNLFPELANKFSQSSTAPGGGDMGYQPAVAMAPEYFKAINNRNIDYITPPVRTQFGYHIVKVLGIKKFKNINVRNYKKIIYDQKRDKIRENYYSKLKKGASIKINENLLK